ncbi:MAG: DUF3090 family protein [Chloroflexi bacterium]|nr:DUF3090 family protein [Chloroflexota bacterium]
MIDFGLVDAVDAEASGPPGQRTFRLRARVADSYAALWMEKEQLLALGRSFSQLLAERSRQRGRPVGEALPVGNFPDRPDVDFRIARLGLDFDADSEHLIILADDGSALERGDSPAFRMALDRTQAIAMIRLIEKVVAAGRPLCPLCRQALDRAGAAHFCPPTNGHSEELEVPSLEEGEEDEDEDAEEGEEEEED